MRPLGIGSPFFLSFSFPCSLSTTSLAQVLSGNVLKRHVLRARGDEDAGEHLASEAARLAGLVEGAPHCLAADPGELVFVLLALPLGFPGDVELGLLIPLLFVAPRPALLVPVV